MRVGAAAPPRLASYGGRTPPLSPMQRVTGTTGLSGTGRSDWQTRAMHARSALFDVYGDHLATRDHRAPVAGLVRLLGTLGIAAPAVRTAISRMVAQGWLEHATVEGARGYAATPQAVRRLAETSDRVYRQAYQPDEARTVMLEGRGRQFDADLLDLFFGSFENVLAIRRAAATTTVDQTLALSLLHLSSHRA